MYPTKLMTEFDFTFDSNDEGVYTHLKRLVDGSTKTFFRACSSLNVSFVCENLTSHMNSLTDELCLQFFPDANKKNVKVTKLAKAPDLSQVKNLRVEGSLLKIGKKGTFDVVSKEVFHAELVRRYGEPSADKWLEEFKC